MRAALQPPLLDRQNLSSALFSLTVTLKIDATRTNTQPHFEAHTEKRVKHTKTKVYLTILLGVVLHSSAKVLNVRPTQSAIRFPQAAPIKSIHSSVYESTQYDIMDQWKKLTRSCIW